MTLRSFVLAVSLVILATSATAQQASTASQPDVRQEVEAFVAKYLDAYNRKDAAAVASLYAENGVLYAENGVLVPPGPMVTGKPNIEKAWRAVFEAGRTGLRYETREVHPEGDVVWSIGQFTVMSPEQGGILQERRGNFVNIYQKQGNDLKFRVHAFNFLPSSPAAAGTSTTSTTGTGSTSGR
jgi:uncharacterized protein (TIGR02246 family)